jgi:hypothetical protein
MSYTANTLAAAFGAALFTAPVAMAQDASAVEATATGKGTITVTVANPNSPLYAETQNGVLGTEVEEGLEFASMEECLSAPAGVMGLMSQQFARSEFVLSTELGYDLSNTFGVEVSIECTNDDTGEVKTASASRFAPAVRP